MNFVIETVDAPAETAGRTAEPNPFIPESGSLFPTAEGKAMRIKLDGDATKDDAVAKIVTKLTGQARNAAKAVDLTARCKTEQVTEGTGKSAKVRTVFVTWSRPKITRPRTSEENAAETPAETPAA